MVNSIDVRKDALTNMEQGDLDDPVGPSWSL